MKKFIIIILSIFTLCSCSMTLKTLTGDITLANYEGETIRYYENSTLEITAESLDGQKYAVTRSIKSNGALNFFDANGEAHYISGGIIIIDNMRENTEKTNVGITTPLRTEKDITTKEHELNEKKAYYNTIIAADRKEMKTLGKDNPLYQIKQERIAGLKNEIKKIDQLLWNECGIK